MPADCGPLKRPRRCSKLTGTFPDAPATRHSESSDVYESLIFSGNSIFRSQRAMRNRLVFPRSGAQSWLDRIDFQGPGSGKRKSLFLLFQRLGPWLLSDFLSGSQLGSLCSSALICVNLWIISFLSLAPQETQESCLSSNPV
jgi:hypothetical protein